MDRAFLKAVDRGVHSHGVRKAAQMVVDETAPMSEQELRLLRGALRNTEFQALSNNSAWCRAVFGREQSCVALDLPEGLEEYEMVGVVATVTNSPVVQEVGLTTMILDTIRGTGKRADKHLERVSVQDLKLQRGAQTARQGEGGIIPEGRDVVFRASWCRGLRALLNNRRQVEVEGVTMTFCLKLPRDQQLSLNRNSTSRFLKLCKDRGMTEDEAVHALVVALTQQLRGVAGVVLVKCRYPQGGGAPDLFWDWWSPSVEVRIVFDGTETMLQALISLSTAAVELWLFDWGNKADSVIVMRAWAV